VEDFSYNKPEINYPCNWFYKIIGTSVDDMIIAIEEIVIGLEYEITPSNISRNEKYYSLNLKVLVPSEVMRDLIFQKLDEHSAIKFVL
jgi:putative lipoic acid-binding regulatory protein